MDPIQEILEIVREMRTMQVQARQTQLEAVKRLRRIIRFGGLSFGVILVAYIAWSWFILSHSK